MDCWHNFECCTMRTTGTTCCERGRKNALFCSQKQSVLLLVLCMHDYFMPHLTSFWETQPRQEPMWVPSSSSSQRPPGRRKVFFMNCGTKRYSGHFRVSSVVLWYLRFAGSKVLCLNAWIIVVAVRNRFCLPGYFRAFRISRQVLSCCDAFSLLPKGSDCCSQANCVCVPRSCLN